MPTPTANCPHPPSLVVVLQRPTAQPMHCIVCGKRAGYNRAVVDLVSGLECGHLCVACEREAFGFALELGIGLGSDSCSFCDRDGQYAVPKWEGRSREVDGDLRCSVEYDTSTATLLLCDEHFHRIQATVAKNDEPAKANRTPVPRYE